MIDSNYLQWLIKQHITPPQPHSTFCTLPLYLCLFISTCLCFVIEMLDYEIIHVCWVAVVKQLCCTCSHWINRYLVMNRALFHKYTLILFSKQMESSKSMIYIYIGTLRAPFLAPSPNSARFSYAPEGAFFISTQLFSNVVSALRKVRVLIWL